MLPVPPDALTGHSKGSRSREDSVPLWLELLIVLGVTLLFVRGVAGIGLHDMPMGDGWMRYLRNVQVLTTGQWAHWQTWRAPGHALTLQALLPLTGSLVEAARLLSLTATALLLPLTWLLGRQVFGRWSGIFAMLLLASWVDLRVMALQSTPYAMVALLLALAALFAVMGLKRRPWLGLFAGLAMGMAWGTDLRASGICVFLLSACLLSSTWREVRWRGLLVGLALFLVAAPLSQAILSAIPVELVPLSHQIGLQRDLNAQTVGGACKATQGQMPVLWDLLSDCTLRTAQANLHKLMAWFPLPVWLLAGLGLIGLSCAPRGQRWRLLPLLALLLPMVPTLLIVQLFHRYCLLIAAPAAALCGAGLWRLCRLLGPRAGPALGVLLLLGLGLAWQRSPCSILARIEHRATGRDCPIPPGLTADNEVGHLVATLRARAVEGAPITDCTQLELGIRLYPRPVYSPSVPMIPDVCPKIYTHGAHKDAWLIAPAWASELDPAWKAVERFDIGQGVILFHAEGT